jgi:F-type H+-transporting ATPase subunit b
VFLSIDGTLLVQVVNFVVFIILLNIVFLRPVGAAIAKRRAYIESVAHDIEAADNELRSARATADDRRLAARRAAEATLAKARAAAQNEGAAILAEFSDRAAAKAQAARERVDEEVVQARARGPELVGALAETMLQSAIGSGASAR